MACSAAGGGLGCWAQESGHERNSFDGGANMSGGELALARCGCEQPRGAGEQGETARQAAGRVGQQLGGLFQMSAGETDRAQGVLQVMEALGGGTGPGTRP